MVQDKFYWEKKDENILRGQAVNLATTVVLKRYPEGTVINNYDKLRERVKVLADNVFIPLLKAYHQEVDQSVEKARQIAEDCYTPIKPHSEKYSDKKKVMEEI